MRGRNVFVAGGGNSAGQTALHMAKWASQVTILVRGGIAGRQHVRLPHPRDRRYPERATSATACRWPTAPAPATSNRWSWKTPPPGRGASVPADALFVLIGSQPRTQWLGESLARDQRGFILTGPDLPGDTTARRHAGRPPLPLETSLPGVFAAGDVRRGSVKRVASAVGEGAVTIPLVHRYLETITGRARSLTCTRRSR